MEEIELETDRQMKQFIINPSKKQSNDSMSNSEVVFPIHNKI